VGVIEVWAVEEDAREGWWAAWGRGLVSG
jgi:hypothetical protein